MKDLRFVYDEPAAVIKAGRKNIIVVGDLHIGAERTMLSKGINIYNATELIAKKLIRIAEDFDSLQIIMLGDIKDSILNPGKEERSALQRFFLMLKDYNITVTRGNHDSHLSEIVDLKIVDEEIIGRFALLHGNRWPSEKAMQMDYIMTAHNHIAASFTGNGYTKEKVWLVAMINKINALRFYKKVNSAEKLIMMPAFNDFIIGRAINETAKIEGREINPLVKNSVFNYKKGKVYDLKGELLGELVGLLQKNKDK